MARAAHADSMSGKKLISLVDAGNAENILHAAVRAGEDELSAHLRGFSETEGDNADAGAVDIGNMGQIDHDLAHALIQRAEDGAFDLAFRHAERDASCDVHDQDAGLTRFRRKAEKH